MVGRALGAAATTGRGHIRRGGVHSHDVVVRQRGGGVHVIRRVQTPGADGALLGAERVGPDDGRVRRRRGGVPGFGEHSRHGDIDADGGVG